MPRRLNNLPGQKLSRRRPRTHRTPAEATLWLRLQRQQLLGRRLQRQHSVDPYILDLYSPSERLAVELDCVVHDDSAQRAYDEERTRHLTALGIRVVRFENRAVFEVPEAVPAAIAAHFRV